MNPASTIRKTGDFGLYDDPGLPQLEHTLQRYPDVKIFGHGPVFWAEIGKLNTPASRNLIFKSDGNQVGRLPQGKIVEEGSPEKIFTSPEHPRLQDFLAKVL